LTDLNVPGTVANRVYVSAFCQFSTHIWQSIAASSDSLHKISLYLSHRHNTFAKSMTGDSHGL